MGIYETLYAFLESYGRYMGEEGTSPWSQGFPRTDQLPNGPELPSTITVTDLDRKYPKAWGMPELRTAICNYYNRHYDAGISPENVMVFAGGRPALIACLLFLAPDINVCVASTEYTPYYDILHGLKREYTLIPSNEDNGFKPAHSDYLRASNQQRSLILASNPCNPTGITLQGQDLQKLVSLSSTSKVGLLIDEAYELLHNPPVSALQYIDDIDQSNLFVVGAATKGLQAPGIRIGWVISSRSNVEILGNFSSFGMGGVSHPSQCYALELLQPERMIKVRDAVPAYYNEQRARYAEAFQEIGLKLFSGDGGFYHWCKLPGDLTADELNKRLFKHGAAILKGTDCDMARLGKKSPLQSFFRFSFGPLHPESFDSDIGILRKAIQE